MKFTEDLDQFEVEADVEGSIEIRVGDEILRLRSMTPHLGTNKFKISFQRGFKKTRILKHAKDAPLELLNEV